MGEDQGKIRRYELLDQLLELLSHGEAHIKWADRKIVEIERIITEAKITADR